MSQSTERGKGAGSFKDRVHGMLRESILDAAWERAVHASWSQIRIADIAGDVGVSRQTIYNEFGTKDQLSLALFDRELRRVLVELEARLASTERFDEGIRAALLWMLDEVTDHALLGRMVNDAKSGSGDGLVPVLTVRSDMIITPVRGTLARITLERWPGADAASVEVVCDMFVRFILSQIITPTDLDRVAMVDAMVTMAKHIQLPASAG
ncbi:TetR family transcriptional regulator [Nocardioides jensenii]|uniref:TetR family transcriptional regulator n=1 Tax=Nocardioides jensenii TaxID=1843 RepID=UPI00082AF42B|nr:TetR family transcriptional regulator [Nocardioides jensenii]